MSRPTRTKLPGVTAAVCLLLHLLPVVRVTAQTPPKRHAAELARLDAHLAASDFAAAESLLRHLQPQIDADERFAFDAIYVLVVRRRFSEAKDQWNRLAPRLQEGLRPPSGEAPSPATEADRQRRTAEALFVQGLLTARTGPKEEALRLLQQADGWGFPPLDSPLMRLAADCLSELQEPALAAQAYGEILKRSPEDLAARLGLGAALLASGRVAAAEKEAREALRRRPDAPQGHFLLGAALLEEKQADEARTHLESALATDPGCVGCLARLAHVAYLAGDDRQCESWLAKAEALDPGNPDANLVAGMLANRTGRHDQAIQHLSRVVDQVPGSASAQYQLALAYRRSGDAEKAREHQAIYDRLIQEQKARTLGVRGAED